MRIEVKVFVDEMPRPSSNTLGLHQLGSVLVINDNGETPEACASAAMAAARKIKEEHNASPH